MEARQQGARARQQGVEAHQQDEEACQQGVYALPGKEAQQWGKEVLMSEADLNKGPSSGCGSR